MVVSRDLTAPYRAAVSNLRALAAHERRILGAEEPGGASSDPHALWRRKGRPRTASEEQYLRFRAEAAEIYGQIVEYMAMLKRSKRSYLADRFLLTSGAVSGEHQTALWADADRAQWDDSSREIFRSCAARIGALQSRLPKTSEEKDSLLLHEEAVLWFLGNLLSRATRAQTEMQMVWADRLAEKMRRTDIAFSAETKQALAEYREAAADEEDAVEVSPQQRLQLEHENQLMLEEFEGMNQQVRVAHQTITEILGLQAQLETHILTQYEQLTEIHAEAIEVSERVKRGNQYLNSARKNSRETTKFVIFVMIILTVTMLFLDFYND